MVDLFLSLILVSLIYGFYIGEKEKIDEEKEKLKKTLDEKLEELKD